jgi:hypothetical protein
MDEGRFFISAEELYQRLGTSGSPVILDVRRASTYDADDRTDQPIITYCAHGYEISQGAAETLRGRGLDSRHLAGGIGGWLERGLPTRRKTGPAPRQWVTRERTKIDRIACPWLIRRFIDPEAAFRFVPTEKVFAVAEETGATAYDIPGAEPFSHDGELCSFDGSSPLVAPMRCWPTWRSRRWRPMAG